MVDVKRKERESLESLIRRFNKRVIQSGKIFDARKGRFFERKKSRNLRRRSAIRAAEIKAEKDLERKLGKMTTGADRRSKPRRP